MRKITLAVLLLVPAVAAAQNVSYTVTIPKPTASLLHVLFIGLWRERTLADYVADARLAWGFASPPRGARASISIP